MKKFNARYKLWAFSPVLFLGIVACADVQNQDVQTAARPVGSTSGLAPQDDVAYQGAVRAINGRDYGRALDYLQTARSIQRNDVRVLNAFGVVYDKLGRFDLSARYYGEALAIEPHSAIVLRNVTYSSLLQGMQDGQQKSTTVATLLPAIVPPAATTDLVPVSMSIAAQDEIAPASQSSPIRIPLRVKANPPPIPTAFSVTVQSPDLGPLVTPTDWATTAQALSTRAPVMVSPSLSPATPFASGEFKLASLIDQTASTLEIRLATSSDLARPQLPAADNSSFGSLPAVPAVPQAATSKVSTLPSLAMGSGAIQPQPITEASTETSQSYVLPQRPAKMGPGLIVIDATGENGVSKPLRQYLLQLGWTAPLRVDGQSHTTVRLSSSDSIVAPVPVKMAPVAAHLSACVNDCNGIQLFVAGNYWGWNRETNSAVR